MTDNRKPLSEWVAVPRWLVDQFTGSGLCTDLNIKTWQCDGPVLAWPTKVDETQPTELEMHRADYEDVRAAGFDCPGELLAAYKRLVAALAATEYPEQHYNDSTTLVADAGPTPFQGRTTWRDV
ncbi:MAG: hypothetical protein V4787_11550 [Pseudomonadota bacterium]